MFRYPWCPRACALALTFLALSVSNAFAHCFVGARFFPATLATDDPCVADEMSLPTVSWMKTADNPPASEWDISAEVSKRITEDFGISIGDSWSQIRQPGGPTSAGFGDLETTAQYQLLKNGDHELALLLGLIVDWGGTGATNSGIGSSTGSLTPTFYFGKGFGDLPDQAGWLRAFAITGQIGYQIPTSSFDVMQGTFNPKVLVYGGSVQYSMPYLKSEIRDYQLPDFINHLIPIVEAQFQTPVANNFGNSFVTTGTINPGVIWVGSYFQVGLEAQVPVNRASGSGVGVLGQLHLYLDDMFPTTIGQPLLGGSTTTTPRRLSF
ncbi:MAG TPA: hypothetical protein VHU22_08875 [Xanthobacteraceae bacterium]|jgi:hypothetical protein|nr:hypothetical protein [Xanthobacteraceae bacterium]